MEHITIEECCDILDSRRIPITASERRNGRYPYYGANGIQDYVADYIFDDELVLLAEDGGNFGSKTRPIAYRVSGKCWVNNHAHVLKPMANVDVDYLCYSLMFYDTEELVNGATRQKLTQAAMRKMLIPQRPITEQKKIVSELSKIQSIISVRQQQLQKLDELVKSRFVVLVITYQSHLKSRRTIMSKTLNLAGMLDFSEVDLTAPDKVIEEILEQLPEDTQNIIWGRIVAYDGHVTSYTSIKTSLAEAIGTITTEKRIDIQDSLGKCGEEEKKFECFLYTSGYEKYRYRMFFMKYGTAHYPVQFTLEESIAENIGLNGKYIQICNSRNEVEDLIVKILTSKKVLRVMQELIRIHQAKSSNNIPDSLHDGTSNAE